MSHVLSVKGQVSEVSILRMGVTGREFLAIGGCRGRGRGRKGQNALLAAVISPPTFLVTTIQHELLQCDDVFH